MKKNSQLIREMHVGGTIAFTVIIGAAGLLYGCIFTQSANADDPRLKRAPVQGGTLSAAKYPPCITEMLTPFKRLSDQPILSPRAGTDMFDSAGAFNPTATRLPDGRIAMLYRAQDEAGISRIGYAESTDGVHFTRLDKPVLEPRQADESMGIEDPRLTADPLNPDQWHLTATAYDGKNAKLVDYQSTDLHNWTRHSIIMPAYEGTWNTNWTKSGSLLSEEVGGKFVPVKIGGKFWMYYLGTAKGVDEMGLASSLDGINWKDATDKPVLPHRPGEFDSRVVEPGPPAVLTKDGITVVYNGADDQLVYKTGVAVFDRQDPSKLLYRTDKPIFSPETPWEKNIASKKIYQAPNVVFVEGMVSDGSGGYFMYYGSADSYVGVAHTKFGSVANSSPPIK